MRRNEETIVGNPPPRAGSPDPVASRRPVTRSVRRAEGIEVTLELPGVSAGRVEISCEGRRLLVRADAAARRLTGPWAPVLTEIEQGAFEVTLAVPPGIAIEGIEADLHAGVLTLVLPRQVAQIRTIQVGGE